MRRSRRWTLIATALALVAGLGACSQPGDRSDTIEGRLPSVSIVTGGTAGVYYPIGGALRGIIREHVEDTTASVEATGASVENLRLVGSGQADIAVVMGDAADQAYRGEVDFEGEPVETNTLVVLYPNVYHTVTLAQIKSRLGLECFADLAGRRYSVGDVGSGNEAMSTQVFGALGIDPFTGIQRSNLSYAETQNALTSGGVDAGAWVVGQGHGGISELAATDDIALVPMCPDEVQQIIAGPGGYTEHTIPAGTYPGVDEDVTTVTAWNAVVVRADFDEQQAYDITKAIFEHRDQIVSVYAGADEYLVPESADLAPVPIHPGARRYYDEVGVEIQDGG